MSKYPDCPPPYGFQAPPDVQQAMAPPTMGNPEMGPPSMGDLQMGPPPMGHPQTGPPPMGPQVMVVPTVAMNVGSTSQAMICPSCHHQISTRVQHESSVKTHLVALVLCLVFWPAVCLPYCIDTCKNARHYCPSCNAYIGEYSGF